MTVTAIVKRRRQARYDVYLDGEYFATLSEDAILSNRLKTGMEVDRHEFAAMVVMGERQDAVNYLLSSLSTRAHTVRTAKDKLKERGFSPDAQQYAIEKMQYYGYIDDALYARDYVDQFAATRSKLRIKQDLRQKGISDAIIDPLLARQDEGEACYASLCRKVRNKVLDDEGKLKLARSLAQQGYSYDVVRACIARYMDEHPQD